MRSISLSPTARAVKPREGVELLAEAGFLGGEFANRLVVILSAREPISPAAYFAPGLRLEPTAFEQLVGKLEVRATTTVA